MYLFQIAVTVRRRQTPHGLCRDYRHRLTHTDLCLPLDMFSVALIFVRFNNAEVALFYNGNCMLCLLSLWVDVIRLIIWVIQSVLGDGSVLPSLHTFFIRLRGRGGKPLPLGGTKKFNERRLLNVPLLQPGKVRMPRCTL